LRFTDHPTVRAYEEGKIDSPKSLEILESAKLKQTALAAGADDAGLIDLSWDAMIDYRKDLLDAMTDTQSVMVLVFRVNQHHLKSCPVGAVRKTDDFDFMACYSHNYRERLGGFQNWVEQVVDSKGHADYRRRVSDRETISMWQHLAIGAQTRCDRCMAVCPAGEAAIGEYLDDRKAYTNQYLKKFRNLVETIYVVKGSDAEQHVRSNFPAKRNKIISNGIRPTSVAMFLESLPLAFQPGQSEGLNAVYHFTFTGNENLKD